MIPPLITLEEHYASSSDLGPEPYASIYPETIVNKIRNLDEGRINDMDAGKVSIQVLSHTPLEASVEECHRVNDDLANACKKYPNRMVGFATLPMREPEAAAAELKRTVQSHGFVGALIDNQLEDGQTYDDHKFWPVFAEAEKLDVPIYIHPTYPGTNLSKEYHGNYPESTGLMLGTFSWGWHAETGLHILRLFAAGLFDKYPKLKIVIGHMGEFIPYMFARIEKSSQHWGKRERTLRTVWNENIWITTSGHFALPPFECLIKTIPVDKVLYSIDYPFSSTELGLKFVEEVRAPGVLTEEQFEGFCYKNAEKLLKLKVQQ